MNKKKKYINSNLIKLKLIKILKKMRKEAEKRNAPVLKVEKELGKNKFKMLIFVMLSARTRDEITLKATKRLFSIFKTPKDLANAKIKKIEKMIYGVGFYKNKAKYVKNTAKNIAKNGLPNEFDKLIKLPGIGRKTANVFLAHAFKRPTIGVDVHVHRISNRIGLACTKKPFETEKILNITIPNKLKNRFNQTFVAYGQTICMPKNPLCKKCFLNKNCPKIGLNKLLK